MQVLIHCTSSTPIHVPLRGACAASARMHARSPRGLPPRSRCRRALCPRTRKRAPAHARPLLIALSCPHLHLTCGHRTQLSCNLSTTAAPRSPGCAPQPWPPCWPPPGCVGWRVVGWRTPTAVVDPGSPVNACVRLRCQQERRNGKRDLLSHTTRESSCVHACVLMLARLARGAPAEDCARPRRGPGNNIYMILFNNIDNN